MQFRFFGVPLLQLLDSFWQQAFSDLHSTISAFQATAPPSTAPALQRMLSVSAASVSQPDFCSLTSFLQNQRTYDLLVDRSGARDKALIRCLTHSNAGTWLLPCSTESLGLRLIPAENTALSKLCLDEPLLPPDADIACGTRAGRPTSLATTSFAAAREA